MNMHWIDWSIVAFFVALVVAMAAYTTRYMHSVADFLAGSRLAGRYLLSIDGINTGAISMVALWELVYNAGYAAQWWGGMSAPIGLIITLSGWVVYRYRQTRAFTLAQFFELRYSRRFRIFAGILGYASGVINYGIFPAVAARFFVYFCGLPEHNVSLGGFEVSLTYAAIMLILLGFATIITLVGGQIAIMITDCVQGIICMLTIGILGVWLLHHFSWDQIFQAFQNAPDPEKASLINPFKTSKTRDFNIFYYLIGAFGAFYGVMAWQGNTGTSAAPKTPHEARMARVIGGWRGWLTGAVIGLLPICAFTVMHHADFSSVATEAKAVLAQITNPAIQKQMTVPVVLGKLFPVGMMGLLCMIVFCAMVTTDDTYLHSWGSILVQDVIMPFRQKPFTPAEHIRVLRWSITGVAVFDFLFSLLFRQTQYILMFFAITGAIFTGGAGAVIVGGLYWKRGTTAGAWCAMILGSVLAVSSIVLQQFPFDRITVSIRAPQSATVSVAGTAAVWTGDHWEAPYTFWKRHDWQTAKIVVKEGETTLTNVLRYAFAPEGTPPVLGASLSSDAAIAVTPADGSVFQPRGGRLTRIFVALRSINGQVGLFIAMISAIAAYIIVSLLGRQVFDMDQLLHRGKYAVANDVAKGESAAPARGLKALMGVTPEFTRTDKWLYFGTLGWSVFWIIAFFVLLVMNLIEVRSDLFWFKWWRFNLLLHMGLGVLTVIWFSVGGLHDIRDIVGRLKELHRNDADDGRVEGHHNLGEAPPPDDNAG
jgi:SSS family solute:Na+ symporter